MRLFRLALSFAFSSCLEGPSQAPGAAKASRPAFDHDSPSEKVRNAIEKLKRKYKEDNFDVAYMRRMNFPGSEPNACRVIRKVLTSIIDVEVDEKRHKDRGGPENEMVNPTNKTNEAREKLTRALVGENATYREGFTDLFEALVEKDRFAGVREFKEEAENLIGFDILENINADDQGRNTALKYILPCLSDWRDQAFDIAWKQLERNRYDKRAYLHLVNPLHALYLLRKDFVPPFQGKEKFREITAQNSFRKAFRSYSIISPGCPGRFWA